MSVATNTSTADLCSDLPDLLYPSNSELADPPAPTHTFTFKRSGVAEAPRVPPVSFCYGPFRVFRTLGEGGFAKAMAAQDMASNRLLCLKVFQKDRLKDMFTEDVILDELDVYKRLASSMPCPASNFLTGLELSFQTKYEICFAMDLMASDLCKYMMRRPSYCFKNARRWTAQLALGINALHNIGIIHRDIKPENILIDVRENVRIADYGLCYIDKYRRPLDRKRAYTTSAVGTTCCMAPEVLRNIINPGSKEYGTPVDWWSLGCVAYQLVSKKHKAFFSKKDDILDYASWCSSGDRISGQHPIFEDFPPMIADLLSGLLNPDLSTRYGFPEVVCHRSFVRSCGESEFSDAHSRARGTARFAARLAT